METERKIIPILVIIMIIAISPIAKAQDLYWGGFVEGLWGAGLDDKNPTNRDYPVAETRLQLRLESYSNSAETFARLDFVQDGFDSTNYDFDVREAYVKFRLPYGFDFKIGRQILTWGTGDLIFINDVFAKDYQSFFIGRQDQYLKAPQTALRMAWYNKVGSFEVAFIPDFEPNITPTGDRLSFYNSFTGEITGSDGYMTPVEPSNSFDNAEIAFRYKRSISGWEAAAYAYRGFYKDPKGVRQLMDKSYQIYYPRLNVYGASLRGQMAGGILWLEGGYYDSREDQCGKNLFIENSSIKALVGFERQVATDFTGNIQFQTEVMDSYDNYEESYDMMVQAGYIPGSYPKADEVRTLLTSRWTKQLMMQTLTFSAFGFYSPSDEDAYMRFSVEYKYTDELSLMAGGNIFEGNNRYTMFGQFDMNDNLYLKINYGF